jgi:RHS repeat-associated protein
MLNLAVAHDSASYQYPITVDPEVIDTELSGGEVLFFEDWSFYSNSEHLQYPHWSRGFCAGNPNCGESERYTAIETKGYPAVGAFAFFEYQTQGESHIYAFIGDTRAGGYSWLQGSLRIEDPEKRVEGPQVLLTAGAKQEPVVCPGSCAPEAVTSTNDHNAVFFQASVIESPGGKETRQTLENTAVSIEQEKGPSATIDTSDATVNGGTPNALFPNVWIASKSTHATFAFATRAFDPGVGVKRWDLSAPGDPGWGGSYTTCEMDVQCTECYKLEERCSGGAPLSLGWLQEGYDYFANGHPLPEGEDTIESSVEDAAGLKSPVTTAKVKIDNAAPYALKLAGLPSDGEISDAQSQLHLKGSATDGSGTTPSSGVASIALSIDGHEVGTPTGSCSAPSGPCTATAEWALNTEEYAAGKHTFTLTATDRAGNVETASYSVTIHHAAPVAMGPGTVNPVTGDFTLSATDVSIGTPGASLTLTRSYASRHLSAGSEGPLGPQWTLSVGATRSITKTATGNLVLTSSEGQQTVFTSSGAGSYAAPSGDANLTLSEKSFEGSTELLLSNGGAVTTYRHVSGGNTSIWLPAISEGTGGTNTTTISYGVVGGVTEPAVELAPVPAGVSCAPTLTKGCRALIFKYTTTGTTATGEARSQWGNYEGRLQEVLFTAWEPAAGEMVTRAVAKYEYDGRGELRAEWNPQISPALKTIYGASGTGLVTAITPPGEQPWLLTYGTSEGDPSSGRLISVTRPAAATAFTNGEVLKNTAVPTLSSSKPAVGTEIKVASNGTWSNSPLSYGYQWEDCNTTGGECTAIPGAVNQSYYPAASDEGHTLVARVSATNSIGTVEVATAATAVVATGKATTKTPAAPKLGTSAVWTIDYNVPVSGAGAPYALGSKEVEAWAQHDDPAEATALFPPDEPEGWPAENYRRATVLYLDSHDRQVNVAAPSGGISTVEYNETNDVTRTLSADDRQTALNAGAKSAEISDLLDTEKTYGDEGTELLSTLGPQHPVTLANGTTVEARPSEHYFYDEGAPTEGGPYRLVTKITSVPVVGGKEETEEERTTVNSYSGQSGLGWKLRKPTSTTVEPEGVALTHTTFYEAATGDVIETRAPGSGLENEPHYSFEFTFGKKGTAPGELEAPSAIAISPQGTIYVSEKKRVEVFNREGKYLSTFLSIYGIKAMTTNSAGDVWVVSEYYADEYSPEGKLLKLLYLPGAESEKSEGIAVGPEGHLYVAGTYWSKVFEYALNKEGQYEKIGTLGIGTMGAGEEEFHKPRGIAVNSAGDVFISDSDNDRIEEYGPSGTHIRTFAKKLKKGKNPGEVKEPAGITISPEQDVWVADEGNNRIEEFSPTGTFMRALGNKKGEGHLASPEGVAVDAQGDVWNTDTASNAVSEWGVDHNATETQTIYYSATSYYAQCREHPEWDGMVCQTQPAVQPEGTLPKLQVTTYAYNYWLATQTVTNTTGTSTRTTTIETDAAGRTKKTTTSSTSGTALPPVTDAYNEATGALKEQAAGGKKIVQEENSLGQLVSYTDADESTATYSWDIDGRPEKVSDGKGTQTFSYSTTSGFLTKLVDSAAGTFTGGYDLEGHMTSEGYPNGMSQTTTLNAIGEPISLEDVKTTDCTSNCTWFSDSVVPTISGAWAAQTSTFSKETYVQDEANRLTEVKETPTGQGCTTRIYAYDQETNRTSITTRPPAAEGKCATEGGTIEKHTYDEASRLDDTGVAYEPFGSITALPAVDAGGSELKASFYSDNQLATQTQNGETIGYNLDPAGRTRETVSTGTTNSVIIPHYAGPGDSPAWSIEPTTGAWTRNIPGINGALAAIQSSSGSTELQLPDLHGDIIATASLSETETKLHPTPETTEYGVPREGTTPRKYSWLGADALPTELPTGVIAMGARTYIPQLGRFLQEDPVEGGSANAYAYTFGNPVNTADPSGDYTATVEGWAIEGSERVANEGVAAREAEVAAIKAAQEAAARAEAERQATQRAAATAASNAAAYAAAGWAEKYTMGGPSLLETLAAQGIYPGQSAGTLVDEGGYGAGDLRFITYPDDKSPDVESKCNKTGQGCSGHRGGGNEGGDECGSKAGEGLVGGATGGRIFGWEGTAAGAIGGAIGGCAFGIAQEILK